MYNELPMHIRQKPSLNTFKIDYKKHIIKCKKKTLKELTLIKIIQYNDG